jgi:hypothetical protein
MGHGAQSVVCRKFVLKTTLCKTLDAEPRRARFDGSAASSASAPAPTSTQRNARK